MDRNGIDVQVISPYPGHFVYAAPPEVARDSCHIVNDHIADMVAKHPDRLMGMGTVPLQDPGMAVAELDRTVKELGFRGVELCTNVRGVDLTRAGLEKFFARVEELDVMIFLHPFGTSLVGRMEDHYFPNTVGHPLDSALCVGQLIFDGYLERFPKLKICIAHGGGYIPGYWGRFDHAWAHREDCRVTIKKQPSEYLKKLYFDTIVFDERELKHLIEIWGADHIMLGTDYPFDMAEPDPVGFLGRVKGVSKGHGAGGRRQCRTAAGIIGEGQSLNYPWWRSSAHCAGPAMRDIIGTTGGIPMHPAAKLQFERIIVEFARWRALPEDDRPPAPAWWWGPAVECGMST